jgi:hypothetical protein
MVIIDQLLIYQQIPIHYLCDAQVIHFGVQISSNEQKLMSKCQLLCNPCYNCLYNTILMACESWKVVFIE